MRKEISNIGEIVKIKDPVRSIQQSISTGPKSCESHFALILDKDKERLVIQVQRHAMIDDPFEEYNVKKKADGIESDYRSKRSKWFVTEIHQIYAYCVQCVFHLHNY